MAIKFKICTTKGLGPYLRLKALNVYYFNFKTQLISFFEKMAKYITLLDLKLTLIKTIIFVGQFTLVKLANYPFQLVQRLEIQLFLIDFFSRLVVGSQIIKK